MVMNKTRYTDEDGERAMKFLRYNSQLVRSDLMSPGRVDGIRKHVTKFLMWMAVSEEGEGDWIARSLHPGDMPPTTVTVRDWFETKATTGSSFVDAAIGDGTAIADDTFIGIYGGMFHMAEARNLVGVHIPYRPPVTAVRFVVGGTRVAEWDLFSIWKAIGVSATTSVLEVAGAVDFPVGIAESPVFISQNKTLLLQYYEMGTIATDFVFQLLGTVVEKRGAGNGLNP